MRLPLHGLLFLALALLATLPADAQTTPASSSQPPAALQNQLVERADGTIYLVRDGTRHLVTPASLSDDDVAAIPEGSAYTNGLVPVDAITALVGGGGPPAVFVPSPVAAAAPASLVSAPAPSTSTPAPTSTPTSPATTVAALPSSVHVTLDEWSITPDAPTVAAGKVSFDVNDAGKGEHEMVLFKSDKDPSSLPVSKGKVDETAIGQKIGEVDDLRPGDDKSSAFDVTPGTYILICNLTNHYSKGMVQQIQVK